MRKTFRKQVTAHPPPRHYWPSALELADLKKDGDFCSEPTAAERADEWSDYTLTDWSDSDASNPEGEGALESAVTWRKVQKKQTIQALALLCYKWLEDGGFKDIPDPRDVDEVLARVHEEVMGDSSFDEMANFDETRYILVRSTIEAAVLWLGKTPARNYPLGPTRPSLEDLGDKYETICAAIDCLGGWEIAVSLQHLLEEK